MKKLLIVFALLFSVLGFSQALTDGRYSSEIFNADLSESYDMTFNVVNGIVKVEGIDTSDTTKKTLHENNITTVTWIAYGGVWTENQTYIFTKDATSGKIYMYYLRVVQNEGQIPWCKFMAGQVYKN